MITKEESQFQDLADVLKELFAEGESFLITSQSMYVLINIYEKSLIAAVRSGSVGSTLDNWKRDVAEFREAWLKSSFAASATLLGRKVTVVTESATSDAHGQCDRRKRKGAIR